MSRKTYHLAAALSADLAEDYIAENMTGMMIADSKQKAKAIRKLSDSNLDQGGKMVQDYRANKRAIYDAIYILIEGYKGYKLERK